MIKMVKKESKKDSKIEEICFTAISKKLYFICFILRISK